MEEYRQQPVQSTGMKVGLVVGFIVGWLGICLLLTKTSAFFREGGWGMWPIMGAFLVFLVITIERVRYLFFYVKDDRAEFVAEVQKHLMRGDVNGAVTTCRNSEQPLATIVGAGLQNLHKTDEEIQEAVDEVSLSELPRIEVRTGYLAMIGNIATLLGLLGTIVGLITSFAGVSLENANDPHVQQRAMSYRDLVPDCRTLEGKGLVNCIKQNKATILARGISEAMHCTAFGLLVGIMALLAFSVLNGRTQNLLDSLNDSVVNVMNLAVLHRKAMNLG
ncbi:MAG: MotA/TolQ/ExbB proton channel family protein [Deltaproteobacteria bacterium]|nr:MotA/TolQ/ExbB proton channel family protein [Deltaproteobacteria bacterium]